MTAPLDTGQIESFIRDGFVKLARAFPAELAQECRELLWPQTTADPADPGTWSEPVMFVWDCAAEPFRQAANTVRLTSAFDQLVGTGRWLPRESLGWFVIRFPHERAPSDAGWHVDGSYPTSDPDAYGLNVYSRHRALLMLFLFTDIGPDDAPTCLRAGSHLDVPRLLAPARRAGMTDRELRPALAVTEHRPVVQATGNAGDVYLCHPFLVHAGQPHRGATPRIIAQPGLGLSGELDLGGDHDPTPVEAAVRSSLGV